MAFNLACHDFSIIETEGKPPIHSMRVLESASRSDVSVQLEEEIDYQQLLDLSFFAGVRPGMTIEQAAAILGEPTDVTKLDDGQRTAIFSRDQGYIRVSWKKDTSWGAYWSWRLKYYPMDGDPADFLPPSLFAQLDAFLPLATLTVRNQAEPPGVLYALENGQIEYVEWIMVGRERDGQ